MRIAVDAMGGDYAPREVVRGAVQVAAHPDFTDELVLVGDENLVQAEIDLLPDPLPSGISIIHASERIDMHEHPVQAMRKKRDSSLVRCAELVKSGVVGGTISAGNTGAAMAIALYEIGRIPGIERPGIATQLPSAHGRILLMDAGAMMDCSPHNLLQFAIMASIYATKVLGVANPSVGLMNVGAEPGKGNEQVKAAYQLLKNSGLNFYGNIEGKDVYEHTTDVVICDGFVGNVLLKASEGVVAMLGSLIQDRLESVDPTVKDSLKPVIDDVLNSIDYAETGGAPLLGVDGVSFIAHGRSNGRAIASAIRSTLAVASSGYVDAVREALPPPAQG